MATYEYPQRTSMVKHNLLPLVILTKKMVGNQEVFCVIRAKVVKASGDERAPTPNGEKIFEEPTTIRGHFGKTLRVSPCASETLDLLHISHEQYAEICIKGMMLYNDTSECYQYCQVKDYQSQLNKPLTTFFDDLIPGYSANDSSPPCTMIVELPASLYDSLVVKSQGTLSYKKDGSNELSDDSIKELLEITERMSASDFNIEDHQDLLDLEAHPSPNKRLDNTRQVLKFRLRKMVLARRKPLTPSDKKHYTAQFLGFESHKFYISIEQKLLMEQSEGQQSFRFPPQFHSQPMQHPGYIPPQVSPHWTYVPNGPQEVFSDAQQPPPPIRPVPQSQPPPPPMVDDQGFQRVISRKTQQQQKRSAFQDGSHLFKGSYPRHNSGPNLPFRDPRLGENTVIRTASGGTWTFTPSGGVLPQQGVSPPPLIPSAYPELPGANINKPPPHSGMFVQNWGTPGINPPQTSPVSRPRRLDALEEVDI